MNTLTIPKTIHYCWFGKNDLPPLVKKCIKSWHKYLPDYEFKLWDEQSFDITSNKWCQEAYKQKKYAFVADYVRLKVLYEQGGIYLDTDIQLYKSLNQIESKLLAGVREYYLWGSWDSKRIIKSLKSF